LQMHPRLAPTRKRANVQRGFGLQGHPPYAVIGARLRVKTG
jgi:hypothetical protein